MTVSESTVTAYRELWAELEHIRSEHPNCLTTKVDLWLFAIGQATGLERRAHCRTPNEKAPASAANADQAKSDSTHTKSTTNEGDDT